MLITGIYGGSFNPIHTGHTALAEWLVRESYVDELWLMVSPQNPLKVNAELMPEALRLRLANMAVEGLSGVRVTDFECRLPRPSYMVNTLAALRVTYPERDFVLVIGADNWQRFPQWYHSDEILAHHRVIVYPRPGSTIDPSTLPDGVMMVDAPLFDISSTEIREAIANDPGYDGRGLAPAVWNMLQFECNSTK